MNLKLEVIDKTMIIQFDGELDHHTAQEIREEIDRTIEVKSIKNLIFDLSNLKFMDSSGIGVVIGRYKVINKKGGKVGVINVNPHVNKIFEMSGLFKIINKYSDKNEAFSNM